MVASVNAPPRVLILGGGFAGLETAFLLHMRVGKAVDITIVSDRDTFLFKPNTIYIPFGADPESFLVPLRKPAYKQHLNLVEGSVRELDPDKRIVSLTDGTALSYDFLVIATGSGMRPEEVRGLAEHAATIWTPEAMADLGRRLEALRERAAAGQDQEVLFVVPENNKCSGPLYEIVFMLETWLRRNKLRDRVKITYSTYEQSFIQAFGPRLHDVVVAEFGERGIEGHTGEVVEEVVEGEAGFATGISRRFDELISFPPYVAGCRYEALPSDDRGFLRTELDTRLVQGHAEIYAPGDAGDFPVKQAFLAMLQADATADHIASQIGAREFSQPFDPVSMCVMEMLDKATFAQVPLRLTGDPARPVEVRPDAGGDYKVGVSPLWRLGKKVLGFYLPMRFNAGEPFHAGAAWQLMDVGLKGMAGALAD
jgi:NADH dehydrogenase FAD-containing subunit